MEEMADEFTGQGCSNTELNNDSFQREEQKLNKETNVKKRKRRNENLKKVKSNQIKQTREGTLKNKK